MIKIGGSYEPPAVTGKPECDIIRLSTVAIAKPINLLI